MSQVDRWQPTKLNAVHREMIRLHILGLTNTDIAKRLHVTKEYVYVVLSSDLAKRHIEKIQNDYDAAITEASEDLRELATEATKHLRAIMYGEIDVDYKHKTTVALQVLDRVGLGKITKIHSINENLSREEIESIKARARMRAADIVEVKNDDKPTNNVDATTNSPTDNNDSVQ